MEHNSVQARFLAGSTIFAAVALFVLFNIFNNLVFKSIRFDLTDNKIYTLSEGSKSIITAVKEPIILRFYFSKSLTKSEPYLLNYAAKVKELLRQYERVSNGKILLEIIDPEPFSENEEKAVNYGLQGVPYDGEGRSIYCGLVGTNSLTNKEIIPFFQNSREAYWEYDISQLIYKLSNPVPAKLGIISSVTLQGEYGNRPWVIWEQINQNYEVELLKEDLEVIPEAVKVLMLINPRHLTERAVLAIDQFVMHGGHVLAFVDPYAETTPYGAYDKEENDAAQKVKFKDLLHSWGVEIDTSKVVASLNGAKQVRYSHEGREYVSAFPLWIDIGKENFATDDILTNNLEKLTFSTPGAISILPDATTKVKTLVASPQAMLIDVEKIGNYKQDPHALLQAYKDGDKHNLAVRITGAIKSAFFQQRETLKQQKDTKFVDFTENSNIVVIADTDMMHDHFWVSVQNFFGNKIIMPASGNGGFVMNALDNLSGSDALVSIRNRGVFTRNFDKIRELQQKSQAKYQQKEQDLLTMLEETQKKLQAIEASKKSSNSVLLNEQQKHEEEIFRNNLLDIRKQIREVRHELQKDINALETLIKFFNIWLMPLVIVICSILYAIFYHINVRVSKKVISS